MSPDDPTNLDLLAVLLRIVNGAKHLVAELQLEQQATQASRIMVRRHSEPASSSSLSMGATTSSSSRTMGLTFARELLGVDRLSQSMNVRSSCCHYCFFSLLWLFLVLVLPLTAAIRHHQ